MARIKGKTPANSVQQKLPRAVHWELDKTVELVIRNVYTGEIVGRTGILFSNLESDHLRNVSDIGELFVLDLTPAEEASVPGEFEWNERFKSWCGKSSHQRGGAA